MAKKNLAVDFDGVIHLYESPFTYPNVIPDDPVPGAIEFLERSQKNYNIIVFSTRCKSETAITAMKKYLIKHWAASLATRAPSAGDLTSVFGAPSPQFYEPVAEKLVGKITFTATKPAAHIYLDDRGWRFTGVFPTEEELAAFTPWNKQVEKGTPDVTN